jgi:hypothetical protein
MNTDDRLFHKFMETSEGDPDLIWNKEQFVNMLLTDDEFYQMWGENCCEELNYIERYGVEKSEEIKKKASLKLSGTNNPMYGKKRSDVSKRNKSEESKNNLSKKAKLRALNGTNPFIIPHTCSVCGKVGKGPNMFRYHNDNCKLK